MGRARDVRIITETGFKKKKRSEIRCKTEPGVVIHVFFALGKLAWAIQSELKSPF